MKYFTILFFIVSIAGASAIQQGQWDDFQDGSTQGWTSGSQNPNGPLLDSAGGIQGSGSAFLKVISTGQQGPGGRLVTFNRNQWTGNYTAAGVTVISMNLNNFSNTDLNMRVVLNGDGGSFWTNAVTLPANSGWRTVQFSLLPSNLSGGNNVNATLSRVIEMRILNSTAGSNAGDIIAAVVGIDNITAADKPVPVELSSFTAFQQQENIVLKWSTASEKNNFGFEVQKLEKDKWTPLGFIRGSGTSADKNEYSYIDKKVTAAAGTAYRLKQIDFDGSYSFSPVVYIGTAVPSSFSVSQNYPNPFNPSTKITFSIPNEELVSIRVYDITGKETATLLNEKKSPGSYEIDFRSDGLSSGMYIYNVTAGSFSVSKKMMLLR